MKKALVTGASGFTGSYVCRALLKKGYGVTALVRKSSKVDHLKAQGITLVEADLADLGSLQGIMKDIDIVFHVAAIYRQEVSRAEFDRVHVEATGALLDEAIAAGVKRFVHCSTVGVQGYIKNPPAVETTPYNPGDDYQESKMEGEKLALSYFKEKKMDVVVVRPVGIYGPGDTRFLQLFKIVDKWRFLIGKGNVLYHMTFVEDLAEGIILAGEVPQASGQIYTIGGNEYLPLKDLVSLIAGILGKPAPWLHIPVWPVYFAAVCCEKLCSLIGKKPFLYPRKLDFFTKDRAFDISKAKTELGYEPRVSLKEGLALTAQWYKENDYLPR